MTVGPEEFEMLYEGARRFVYEKLRPLETQVEEEDGVAPELWAELTAQSIELGLLNAHLPEEVGGGGLTLRQLTDLTLLFGHTNWRFSYLLARTNSLMLRCTPEQMEDYLKPVMAGEKVQCFALSEPEAGSYTSGLKTRAVKVDGGWRITGIKHWISNGRLADFAIVVAVTDHKEGGRPEATAFFVDKGTEGFSVGAHMELIGFRGVEERELIFEDCFVPDNKVLGEVGKGLDLGFSFIAERRLFLSAYCVGLMDELISLSVDYMNNRIVQGGLLAKKQGIQWKIADMETDYIAARSVVRAAAESCESVLRSAPEQAASVAAAVIKDVSIAKLLSTTAVNRVADQAVQIHGGLGISKGFSVERIFRDVRPTRIMDGTDEMHREIISREVIRSRTKSS